MRKAAQQNKNQEIRQSTSNGIKNWPKDDRPRERLFGEGEHKLSNLSEVAYNNIINVELGRNSNLTIETLRKITKALKVKVDDLI